VIALLTLILATVFALLGAIHVYWAMGPRGTEGSSAVPQVDGVAAFQPTVAGTFAVAAALFFAAGLVATTGGLLPIPMPRIILLIGCVGLGVILVGRAIGDFRLVGFFKRVTGSAFARRDTLAYSPLCLGLGVGVLALAWVTRTGAG
jgi:hypothetical protein